METDALPVFHRNMPNAAAAAAALPVFGRARPGRDRHIALDEEKTDRRSAVRFPISQDVRYRVYKKATIETGFGKTINISSNGILFTAEREFALGERVEVAVNWPAQLDNKCPLKLVTAGRVMRSEGTTVAIAIDRYEFRTQGIQRP